MHLLTDTWVGSTSGSRHAAVSIGVQVFLCLQFCSVTPRGGVSGSCGNRVSIFEERVHQVGCAILRSHQPCRSGPASPHSCQFQLFLGFGFVLLFILAILGGVGWHLIMV